MDDKEYTMVTPLMKNGTIVDFLRDNLQVNPLKLARNAFRFIHLFTEADRSWVMPSVVFSISTA